jgi:hypothetical protein
MGNPQGMPILPKPQPQSSANGQWLAKANTSLINHVTGALCLLTDFTRTLRIWHRQTRAEHTQQCAVQHIMHMASATVQAGLHLYAARKHTHMSSRTITKAVHIDNEQRGHVADLILLAVVGGKQQLQVLPVTPGQLRPSEVPARWLRSSTLSTSYTHQE